jgi:hypothetical protein
MTPEEKFLFYRKHIDDTDHRLLQIGTITEWLRSIDITIPSVIADNLDNCVSFDSRGDESEAIYEFQNAIAKGPMKLFDEMALVLLSEAGATDHRTNEAVTCSNIRYRLEEFTKKTRGTMTAREKIAEELADTRLVSFAGFRETEINSILSAIKGRAEDRLEKLRDIHTSMRYMKREHMWPNGMLTKNAPPCPPEIKHNQERWGQPFVLSEWWFTTVTKLIVAGFNSIDAFSAPRGAEPDSISGFGSHVSNRITIEFAV